MQVANLLWSELVSHGADSSESGGCNERQSFGDWDIGHALKVRRSAPRLHRFAGGLNRRALVLLECAYERPWNGPDRELTVRLGIKDHRLTAVAKLLRLAGEVDDDHVLAAPADVGVLAKSALQQIITRSAD